MTVAVLWWQPLIWPHRPPGTSRKPVVRDLGHISVAGFSVWLSLTELQILLNISHFPCQHCNSFPSRQAQDPPLLRADAITLSTSMVTTYHRVSLSFTLPCTVYSCFIIQTFSYQLGQDDILLIFFYQIIVSSLVIWYIVAICWLCTDHLQKKKCLDDLYIDIFCHSVFLIQWYCQLLIIP